MTNMEKKASIQVVEAAVVPIWATLTSAVLEAASAALVASNIVEEEEGVPSHLVKPMTFSKGSLEEKILLLIFSATMMTSLVEWAWEQLKVKEEASPNKDR